MYKLVFFVPESHLEQVKTAVFAAGAGCIGHYDQCCWQTIGQGQFRPLSDANPFIGQVNKLETLTEYRVEMVCAEEYIRQVVSALRESHPYEAPAFDVVQVVELEGDL
ncbi:NGG1p interacting factor NIF3 [Cellvibrio sp. KY-GH-1]|uniref:Nif3-like dinuclear metal center hexameric protein n=1 Tax=Cellvibrio sp. KY-GH-1 TaxID=2303332 RepID=UPI0012443A96|nr:YqfO family protein [Cellvibrio sp. KY-GH-1]QEY14536.1 NGG1p interacting factor NIF3 [Cellvibrio sp. KY-GH-1]